jgi:hypothetical protein
LADPNFKTAKKILVLGSGTQDQTLYMAGAGEQNTYMGKPEKKRLGRSECFFFVQQGGGDDFPYFC